MESTNSNNDAQPSKNPICLATSFKKSTAKLVIILKNSRNFVVLIVLSALISVLNNYKHQIDKIKTKLKNKIREMWNIMGKILQAVVGQ